MSVSSRHEYAALPLCPSFEMDHLLFEETKDYNIDPAEKPLTVVVQLNAQRRAALAEVDNAPFS